MARSRLTPFAGVSRNYRKGGDSAAPSSEVPDLEEKSMRGQRRTVVGVMAAMSVVVGGAAVASAAPTEIKGAAILQHACGKVSVEQMGLVNSGKMAEAVKLGTAEMQTEWNAMPKEDREMMTGMMKEMSVSAAQFTKDIQAGGLLVVDGGAATLTVTQEHKDENGTSTGTMTQKFKLDGATCRISK
mgnify:CR=1 FL=1